MTTELRDRSPQLGLDDLGDGEPALLLLTGWCSSRGRWAKAAPLLAANRRVVNFEWRGHGSSAPATADFGTAEMVQDALTAIAATGLQRFVVCAASHSGWIAIELRRGRSPTVSVSSPTDGCRWFRTPGSSQATAPCSS